MRTLPLLPIVFLSSVVAGSAEAQSAPPGPSSPSVPSNAPVTPQPPVPPATVPTGELPAPAQPVPTAPAQPPTAPPQVPVMAPPPVQGTYVPPQPYAPPPFMPPTQPWQPLPPKFVSDRVTESGIPRGQRGGLVVDSAVGGSGDEDFAGGTVILAPSIPLTDAVFLDLTVPFAFSEGAAVGNPTAGVRGIVSLSDRAWLTPHGSLGLPILNEDSQREFYLVGPLVHGLWKLGSYSANTVPVQGGLMVEGHLGDLVIMRGELNLNVLIGYEDNEEPELSIEHAAEIQIGHRIGGGFRMQGVALPTYEDSEFSVFDGDLYQLAIEPFFAFEDDMLFARAGLLLPLDEVLGPPLVQSFSVRVATGFRID